MNVDAEGNEILEEEKVAEAPDPPDIFENFDTQLFTPTHTPTPDAPEPPEDYGGPGLDGLVKADPMGMCPYYPTACVKANTSVCTKECDRHPESYMDPKVKEVFDIEPWSNYCFTCGEFVPSRRHEEALDPPELVYSHIVATGYPDYRIKLSKWVLGRIGGGI
jgi:hypothetical protein